MSYEIEKMMPKMEELKRNKDTLMAWVSNEIASGCQQFDREGCGETIDMIKDLACAEKDCWEAMYYQTVVEGMLDRGNDDMMGYNNRRMSNGQYASAGRGHMGYRPWVDQEPYIDAYMHDPNFKKNMMGYEEGKNYKNMRGGNNSYAGYQNARMAYHQTGSSDDKMRMEEKEEEYLTDTVRNLRDMWDDANPMLKRKIKEGLKDFIEG